MPSKDSAHASFILALFSWIPLLNWVIAPISVYLGVAALIKIRKYPDKYEGRGYAIAGIAISAFATIATIVWAVNKYVYNFLGP